MVARVEKRRKNPLPVSLNQKRERMLRNPPTASVGEYFLIFLMKWALPQVFSTVVSKGIFVYIRCLGVY